MRCVIELLSMRPTCILPLTYNSLLQGFIYRHLDWVLARRVHDEGTPLGKRQFRFFTFSRLLGSYRILDGVIEFRGPFRFHIGSVREDILKSFVEHLLREPTVKLGSEVCEVRKIEVEPAPRVTRPIKVKTLSPITVYSTLSMGNGRKKTYYYSPFEGEWEEHLLANLRRKAQALGWGEARLTGLDDAHTVSYTHLTLPTN